MSLITLSSDSAGDLTMSQIFRCSRSSSVSSSSSVMPMMPFIGVRISWLMFARNSLLARLAASAACFGLPEVGFAFQSMAGIGTLLALLGVWFIVTWARFKRLPRTPVVLPRGAAPGRCRTSR